MVVMRFCARCGRENVPLINNLCINCYIALHPELVSLPKRIEVPVCKRCGKLLFKGKLLALNEEAVEKLIIKHIKTQNLTKEKFEIVFDSEDLLRNKEADAHITVYGFINDVLLKVKRSTRLFLKEKTCDICAKLAGGYHEAILQLRGISEEKFNELKLFVAERLSHFSNDPLARIVDIKYSKHGLDFLIGSQRAARKIAEELSRKFNTKYKLSTKLVGRDKSGRPKHRYTYCVRVQNSSEN
ncbi:MAG: hypothetical protein DRO04_01740 [Candidatus Iainarchaeum archaeon]|uniref:Nmd3 N-terminal domain-containing protein n=1 Tax=Candidatus Iainarchaeum sp. TaxID=3101447 RepID=A0A497JKD5_9ARCH|nr:MAG: hypothetical protein DRO04_01740 [Candidatus Diapherotrites archaeon]